MGGLLHNRIARSVVASLCVGTLLAGSVAPAMARDHGRYGGYHGGYGGHGGYGYPSRYRHYRHRDGLNAGDVIGIAALIGVVAIIASSVSKNSKTSRGPDNRNDDRSYEDRADDRSDYPVSSAGEDAAIDACVSAARDKSESESGGYAEILDVERPRAAGHDGWGIDGRLEERRTYSDTQGVTKRFSCDVQGGRVAYVYISRDTV